MKQLIFTLFLTFVFSFPAFAQAEICPKIEVSGGGVVEVGASMNFTAQIRGKTENLNLKYNWTISNGRIASGQGTPSITADTTGLARGIHITATVEVKGLPENCSATASETGAVIVIGDIFPLIDEFGTISRDEVRARVDAFFVALNNSPEDRGYIVNYGTDREVSAREKLIRNYIALRKYDAARITFVRRGAPPNGISGMWARFYILPPGYEPPST